MIKFLRTTAFVRLLTILPLLLLLLLLQVNTVSASEPATILPIETLTAETFKAMLDDNENSKWFDAVIDVREERTWQSGHIENATLIESLASFGTSDQVTTPQDLAGCEYCNLVIYCNSGNRAGRALKLLREHGFYGRLYNGLGIVQWKAAGYTLVTHGNSFDPPCITTSDASAGGTAASKEPYCYQAYTTGGNMENFAKTTPAPSLRATAAP